MNSRITIVFVVDNNSKQLYSQFNEDTPLCFVRTYVRDVLRIETFQLIHNGRVINNDMLTLKQVINVDDTSSYVNVVFHVNSTCTCKCKCKAIGSNTSYIKEECVSCERYRNAIIELRNSNDVLKEENMKLKMITMNNTNNTNDTHYKYLYHKYRDLYFQEKQAKENIVHQLHTNTYNTKVIANSNIHINVLVLNCVLPFLSKNDFVNISVTSKYICSKCSMHILHYLQKTQLRLTHIKLCNISLYDTSYSQGGRFRLSNSTLTILRKTTNDVNVINMNEVLCNNIKVLEVFKVFYMFRRKLNECIDNDNVFANAVVNEFQQGKRCNNGDIGKYLLHEVEMFDFSYNTIKDIIAFRNTHNIATSTMCNLARAISLIIDEAFIFCGIAKDKTITTQRYTILNDIIHINTSEHKYNTMQATLNSILQRCLLPE